MSYFFFLVLSTIENPCDEGIGAEDLEDPGYLADQGKQPFDHDRAYVKKHVKIASISVAYDHKCRYITKVMLPMAPPEHMH